jgi:ATP-dependent RNA helicase RhlE
MTDSSKSFSDYKLHSQLIQAIEDSGYTKATPIQERCVPLILKGQDIAGLAQTGTGKTAAYLIPLIDRVLRAQEKVVSSTEATEAKSENSLEDTVPNADVVREELAVDSEETESTLSTAASYEKNEDRAFTDWKTSNFILILVPTRELVSQVYENLQSLTKHTNLTSVFLYGGVGYDEQKDALSKPYQFLVSTPGRLIDLYKDKHLDFKQVRAVVFDEADRMFDMGFQQDVFFILRRIPQERQLLMFSATLNLHVTEMAYEAHSNPIEVDVSRDQATADNVEDFIFHVGSHEKPKFLLSALKKYNPSQVIIFSNYKNKIPRVAQFLNDNGYSALGISSLMNQNQRNRVIERFKAENSHNILVATDLAARGLDIKGVDMVINFELPEDAENYVHRIGRTGRAEQKGRAISFVSDKDVESLMRIEDYLKEKLEVIWMDENEMVNDFKPLPAEESRRPAFPQRRDRPERGGRPPRRDSNGKGGPRGDQPRTERPVPSAGPRTHGPGLSNSSGESRPANIHRDKRSGRHRQKDGDRTAAPHSGSDRNRKNTNRKSGSSRPRPQVSANGARTGSRPIPRKQAPTSLLGKITSSVKNLFKRS